MNPLSLEEFISYYHENNSFPNGLYNNPSKKLSDLQLKTKYEKYLVSFEKSVIRKNRIAEKALLPKEQTSRAIRIQEVMDEVKEKDPLGNIFWSKLTNEETYIVKKTMWGDLANYDVAHIVGRGRCPRLADNYRNMLVVPRAFHTFIDQRLNPFSFKHESISEEKANEIWIRLIGQETWDYLQEEAIKTRLNFDYDEEGENINLLG